jgi:hypothetical protein
MIDHKICRLGGNPAANLIIPTVFYVVELQKVGKDKSFLKTSLWPQLRTLYRCEGIEQFCDLYPESECNPVVRMWGAKGTRATSSNTETVEGEWRVKGLHEL